ncbi:MAG TPA: proline dehydrogenase family protein [Candidatus Limnocylindrales bacterium]
MRTILLWMARNPWLREHLPRLGFVRRAVRRFMPGEDAESAFGAAAGLAASGQGILFTRLGENLAALAEADEVAAHYRALLDREGSLPRRPELSVKPTQLGLDIDAEACFRHLDELAGLAGDAGTWLWLDMEGSAYVDATLDLYERLRAAHPNVGICLQAYLKRTPKDLRRLLPLEPAVRLVKGAYDEPATIAHRRRPEVDAAYQALALVLAEAARDGRARCALGTHDSGLIERIATFAESADVSRGSLEVHMLYGIRSRELARLQAAGFPAFTLIAYGAFWYPWYMRRLAERPANVLFALRQLLP